MSEERYSTEDDGENERMKFLVRRERRGRDIHNIYRHVLMYFVEDLFHQRGLLLLKLVLARALHVLNRDKNFHNVLI